ncbi:MAG: response regulator [Candidatus Woesearchaeota archaeon]
MSQYKILIIDDEEDTLSLLKDVFETEGYEVNVARDGPESLETLKEFTPDIILLDIMMPKMNGWVVFMNLQKDERLRKIPVMVVSAKPLSKESKDKVQLLGVKDYIIKPFDLSSLSEKVRAVIEKSENI